MCAIVGLRGEEISKQFYQMLLSLKHRGPDGSGVFMDNSVFYGNLEDLKVPRGSFGMGHNLLSIVGGEGLQPIKRDNFVLVCNGEIYNYRELKKELKTDFITDSDCEVILNLIRKFNSGSLVEAVKKSIKLLDGDYAFAVYDGKDLVLSRDPVGVKPLYYGENSVSNIFGFASERKALWNIGIKDVKTLAPEKLLCNQELIDLDFGLENWISKNKKTPIKESSSPNSYINTVKYILKENLIESVKKRIRGVDEVGIIFSGGVDSTLLAKIAVDIGIKPCLYSVGHEDSIDLKFSKKAAKLLDLPLDYQFIDEEVVEKNLPYVLDAIEEFNVMKIGVGMTAYLASKMAHANGLKVMLSGQGADELFGGYHRYLSYYHEKGEKAQNDLLGDVLNLYHVNLQRDDAACMANSVELRVPYLDKDIINIAMDIPMKYKIKDENDKLRKCILRQVAAEVGVPPLIVNRPKKAAQYGSGIHKILVKKVLKKKDYSNYLKEKYKNLTIK
ncbi:MAG: asparagine synthase (glutamine-hydrolyzing) [Methanobacterium sp. BRmetb2]|jgi:asparagine synthase (glutamine-hydrolysing)|nr:MAG: asparagine synthase (glutamine-hydrolyzing) [Methanobacterium sp. BRmetb2]